MMPAHSLEQKKKLLISRVMFQIISINGFRQFIYDDDSMEFEINFSMKIDWLVIK